MEATVQSLKIKLSLSDFRLLQMININFFTLFSEFNANIYIGGDNVIFWGPLAKTVIYGLLVATFLTLIVVPILFYLVTRLKMRMFPKRILKAYEEEVPQIEENIQIALDK